MHEHVKSYNTLENKQKKLDIHLQAIIYKYQYDHRHLYEVQISDVKLCNQTIMLDISP